MFIKLTVYNSGELGEFGTHEAYIRLDKILNIEERGSHAVVYLDAQELDKWPVSKIFIPIPSLELLLMATKRWPVDKAKKKLSKDVIESPLTSVSAQLDDPIDKAYIARAPRPDLRRSPDLK